MASPKIKRSPSSPTATRVPQNTDSESIDSEEIELPRKSAPAHILTGSVWQGVLKVAIPSVATMIVTTLNAFLDRRFIGGLGTDAIAAVTTSNSLMFAVMSAAMGVSVGTSALVSRFIGERNIPDAEKATQQSLLVSVLMAVAIGIPMWLLRHPILLALGLGSEPATIKQAEAYLLFTLLGLPIQFFMLILSGAFRGMGDTIRPLWTTSFAVLVHGSFNYLLIFGNLGFPKMGIAGGALALVLSQTVSAILLLFYLRRSVLAKTRIVAPVDFDWINRVLRIGLPASAQQLIRVGSMLVFQGLIARLGAGSAAVAALGIGLLSESIAFMPGFGYSIAASAFVGQNLGARQIKRAEQGAYAALFQAVLVMSVMGIVFWVFAEPFVRVFIQHIPHETTAQALKTEQTVHLAVLYLRAAAWSEPFLGVVMVLNGALQGAGETGAPTILTFVAMVLIRLPLTWLLAIGLKQGINGAWWAMSLSTIVNSVFVYTIFRLGKWRTSRI